MGGSRRYLVGVGNPMMGDDGIGVRVVEEVAARHPDAPVECVIAANDGMRVLSVIAEEPELVVIVDCARMGMTPGDASVFGLDDVTTRKVVFPGATHGGDILTLVRKAREAGLKMPKIQFVGIEPANLREGPGLSPELTRRLDDYVARVLATASNDRT